MAGHSQFKNRMHRKERQDTKKAKIFTKLTREIHIAVRQDPNPETNGTLRMILAKARIANLPHDRIKAALNPIQDDKTTYEYVLYEAFFNGIGFLIEALTDNRNRTAAVVRSIISKRGGSLASPNSVLRSFLRIGKYMIAGESNEEEIFLDSALKTDALSCIWDEENLSWVMLYSFEHYDQNRQELEQTFKGRQILGQKVWMSKDPPEISQEIFEKLYNIGEDLEDDDDIQDIWVPVGINDV